MVRSSVTHTLVRIFPHHGHEATAKLCARFVSYLFACPNLRHPPPPPAPPSTALTPRLDHFIAYALHRMRLHASVTFAALYLLQRLKVRFPGTDEKTILGTALTPWLDHFIAYALHHMQLHASVMFAALYPLQSLKARFPGTNEGTILGTLQVGKGVDK